MESRSVPLLDLKAQYATIKGEVSDAIDRVLESQAFILGKEVESMEEAMSLPVCHHHQPAAPAFLVV